MAGYLIAEEGPLAGLVINFEKGEEWVLGRDPDEATIVLEDPRVSRKHVICRVTQEGFFLENLSSVNPSTQNGKVITEAVLLHEGDILQIGSTYFRFTEKNPTAVPAKSEDIPEVIIEDEDEDLSSINFEMPESGRWFLKVISGPNAGAEFDLQLNASYILGRDGNISDVVFHDLSVSRQHAKITISELGEAFIEDLSTRNGVIVNGELITEKKELSSQDLVAIGTTSFLILDREKVHETIISPVSVPIFKAEEKEAALEPVHIALKETKTPDTSKSWKDLVIPTKHLVLAGVFGLFLLGLVSATFSLFHSETIPNVVQNETDRVKETLSFYPTVQFSYNEASGKLFLIGHVLTVVDKQELSYKISTIPFINSIEDTVVIDELVWQNMNALFNSNPDWQAISLHSPSPGKFVLKGYVQTLEQAQLLSEYINANFPYPNLLDNQVVIGNNLALQVHSLLLDQGFDAVVFNIANGELVLSGRIDELRSADFSKLVKQLQALSGIRLVKNYAVSASASSSVIDLSDKYKITGFSKGDNKEQFVVINQKIFSKGDFLNGMQITDIQANVILLEKDGIKFRINYNLQ